MLDKVYKNSYQLGVHDTIVKCRVGSSGTTLEEFSNSCCGTVWGGALVSG